MDKSGHPTPGHPELPVEKAAEIKILSKEDPVPLDLLLRSNLFQQELSRMNINSLSLLDKTAVQITPQVMRMLGGLLEREVTRDDPEWTAAVASLTVSEKMKIMSSRRQHEENERDCRTIVQQLVSSKPHEILTSTSYGRKEQGSSTRRKTVTFVDQDEGEKVEQNLLQDCLSGEMNDEKSQRAQHQHPGQESLSGESEIEEKIPDEKQDLENKVLSGEFRWMRRRHRHDLEERADSITNSSTDDNSDRNSSSGSEVSELAIHTLLVETRARDLNREVYQDPDSDCYLIPSERVFDNAADDLETIAVSKLSISLFPQKEVVRPDLQRSSKKHSRWRRFGALRWKKTHTSPMS